MDKTYDVRIKLVEFKSVEFKSWENAKVELPENAIPLAMNIYGDSPYILSLLPHKDIKEDPVTSD